MFNRLVPHLSLKSEFYFRRPFTHGGKLEEITCDNNLSILVRAESKEKGEVYLDSSKWIVGSSKGVRDFRQFVKQITIHHGN